jgi:hypothetical protein
MACLFELKSLIILKDGYIIVAKILYSALSLGIVQIHPVSDDLCGQFLFYRKYYH